MKRFLARIGSRGCLRTLALLLFLSSSLVTSPSRTTAQATILDLGTLGGSYSEALGINSRGQVVGMSQTAAGEYHAFRWDGGTMIDLGTLGGVFSSARDINQHGQIIGWSETPSGEARSVLWDRDVPRDLGNLVVVAINDRGQIAGTSYTPGQTHAVIWDDGQVHDLGTLPGDITSEASALNQRGQVVGASLQWEIGHAFVWQQGTMHSLTGNGAVAINDRGQIVGQTDYQYPALWEQGRLTILATLPGAMQSVPRDINNRGQIVGTSTVSGTPNEDHATLWEHGRVVDLGALEGHRSSAAAINDQGQIVGRSMTATGEFHAVLWSY